MDGMLKNAARLAAQMRARRFESGALDLEVPELRVTTNEAGEKLMTSSSGKVQRAGRN